MVVGYMANRLNQFIEVEIWDQHDNLIWNGLVKDIPDEAGEMVVDDWDFHGSSDLVINVVD